MIWHRIWHASIKNRLTFLFFSITAGAVMVIYFYVVPQLESNLVSQKVDALRRDSLSYSRPIQQVIGREVTATQLDALTRTISEETGTRVTLLGIPVSQNGAGGSAPDSRPYTISDSQNVKTNLNPSTALALSAARAGEVRSTSKSATGAGLAQAARPIFYQGKPAWVIVFSEPLDRRARQRRPDPASDPDRRRDRADRRDGERVLRGERHLAGASSASSGRPATSPPATSRLRFPSTPRTSSASSPGLQRDAAQARAARHGAPRVHRQRLARAAHADLLAGRLRRAAGGRRPRRGHARGVPGHHARAGAASSEAHHGPARPLQARRRFPRPAARKRLAALPCPERGRRIHPRGCNEGRRDRGSR